jgi:hypothetical protein
MEVDNKEKEKGKGTKRGYKRMRGEQRKNSEQKKNEICKLCDYVALIYLSHFWTLSIFLSFI